MKHAGSINQVDAYDSQRFLLKGVGLIEHSDMNDDLATFVARVGLEIYAKPAVAFVGAMKISRGNSISAGEKRGGISSIFLEAFEIQLLFVVKHGLKPVAANIAFALSVDGIADLHIISRDTFGNCSGSGSGLKKPANDLLTRADFSKSTVSPGVQVDFQGLFKSR